MLNFENVKKNNLLPAILTTLCLHYVVNNLQTEMVQMRYFTAVYIFVHLLLF